MWFKIHYHLTCSAFSVKIFTQVQQQAWLGGGEGERARHLLFINKIVLNGLSVHFLAAFLPPSGKLGHPTWKTILVETMCTIIKQNIKPLKVLFKLHVLHNIQIRTFKIYLPTDLVADCSVEARNSLPLVHCLPERGASCMVAILKQLLPKKDCQLQWRILINRTLKSRNNSFWVFPLFCCLCTQTAINNISSIV